MISVANVSKVFKNKTAVNDISFDVAQGENFILLGTSGCGKTTTLKMINRLIAPSQGTITVNGTNIYDQSPEQLRRGMGYVLQRNSLFPHYSVYENIAVVPQLLKWNKAKTDARINELITKLHLSPDHLHIYPHQLSGGEAQRVNLARALVADPPILLMDEPFSALDTITRSAIRKEFMELDELKKKTIIMVTHDVQEAFELGDRICLMDQGRAMQIGIPADLLFTPANDFIMGFLSDAYMQLAFTIITLQDLWSYLASEQPENKTLITSVPITHTISKTVEQIKDKNDKHTMLAVQQGTELKYVSWGGLLQAFGHYKTNR
jgi:osmoprotectant transport system ATP-binding protein